MVSAVTSQNKDYGPNTGETEGSSDPNKCIFRSIGDY